MSYKEIILRILNSRDNLICVEKHLMTEFCEAEDQNKSFMEWCKMNNIRYMHVSNECPSRIMLTKMG